MSKEIEKKLTVPEIIDYMKSEGITFNLVSEEDAADFLRKHNYFFRIKSYADNFEFKQKTGKYVGLDFGQLQELSTVDMYLRKLLFKMTVDVEHCLKVRVVNDCQENPADDGFEVVQKFLASDAEAKRSVSFAVNSGSYDAASFQKYVERPGVWNLVEMLGFYDFISFFIFYYKYFHLNNAQIKHFDSVRRLRNAAAHNSCMLRSLLPEQNFNFDMDVCFELSGNKCGLTPTEISHNMKIPVLNDFAVMLSVYTQMISSPRIKEMTFKEMKEFFDGRMMKHKDYFSGNETITSAYKYARKVLEWYASK